MVIVAFLAVPLLVPSDGYAPPPKDWAPCGISTVPHADGSQSAVRILKPCLPGRG